VTFLAWGIALVAWSCLPAVAHGFSGSYDQTVTNAGEVTRAKVIIDGEYFRMESTLMGQVAVFIRNRDGLFHYLPTLGMLTKMPPQSEEEGMILKDAADVEAYLQARQGKWVGSESVNGYPCDVYQIVDPKTGGPGKIWIWKPHRFLVKSETTGPSGMTAMELTNIQLGEAVPESTFDLPEGVAVMDGGMLGALQGMFER
jgi:outer membrane lipoprotein-sorting protein